MRIFFYLTFFLGCASRQNLASEHAKTLQERDQASLPQRTVVVFLIDGLSYAILEKQIEKNLPSLKNYFLTGGGRLAKAHSVFPSLTFPNLASLLREAPVHETEMIGNKFVAGGHLIDFESLKDRRKFTKLMHGNNIFTRLNKMNAMTLSLDFGLGADATVSSDFDLKSAYSISQLDYRYVDLKKIDSLKNVLSDTKVSQWPNFIFVHLIGIDFLSHRHGPLSVEALSYLKSLDADLSRVLALLKVGEKSRQVITLLTADHGFNLAKQKYFHIEALVHKINPSLKVINESRVASLYYLNDPNEKDLRKNAQMLLQQKQIERVAFKKALKMFIYTRTENFQFEMWPLRKCLHGGLGIRLNGHDELCTNQLPIYYQNKFDPYFMANITSYFQAKNSADMIVIPNAFTTFSKEGRGHHGGSTEDEVTVPLLMRNASLTKAGEVPAIWNLLKFVD